jgi:uroporphyrinogen decarboxylase
MGLELYTYFALDYPELLAEYMEASTELEIRRVHAAADPALSPVVLIPEDFSTKQGPIFSAEFLRRFHYPHVRRLAAAWKEHGVSVLYHSDGNYRAAVPDLVDCGVDGFYCLEPACGMDIVEFKNARPDLVWAGGLDGVDLMERGSPAEVREAVRRQIVGTRALETGGLFMGTSSEINPPIPPENYLAMVTATAQMRRATT